MTNAEISGIMGWRGPGCYTESQMRKVRQCIELAILEERESCAKICRDMAMKMEDEAASPECDSLDKSSLRSTAWMLSMCEREILTRK